jgi:hypothetical protein
MLENWLICVFCTEIVKDLYANIIANFTKKIKQAKKIKQMAQIL